MSRGGRYDGVVRKQVQGGADCLPESQLADFQSQHAPVLPSLCLSQTQIKLRHATPRSQYSLAHRFCPFCLPSADSAPLQYCMVSCTTPEDTSFGLGARCTATPGRHSHQSRVERLMQCFKSISFKFTRPLCGNDWSWAPF